MRRGPSVKRLHVVVSRCVRSEYRRGIGKKKVEGRCRGPSGGRRYVLLVGLAARTLFRVEDFSLLACSRV